MRGLDYVAIAPEIASDPDIARMATRLRRDRYWVVGHFPEFWGKVALHAPDGKLRDVPVDLLDSWAGGVRGWGALVLGLLCDDSGMIRSWDRYNGRALNRLEKERTRKAAERARSAKKGRDSPRDKDGTVPGTGRGRSAGNTHTVTVTKETTPAIAVVVSPPDDDGGGRKKFLERVPDPYRSAVEGAFRAASNPLALRLELDAIASGMHPPAYDHATLGRALHEMAVAGAPVKPVVIRAFCRRLLAGEPPPRATSGPPDQWSPEALASAGGGAR